MNRVERERQRLAELMSELADSVTTPTGEALEAAGGARKLACTPAGEGRRAAKSQD